MHYMSSGQKECCMTILRYGEEYCQSVRECVVVDMARRDGVGRQLMKQPALCVFHVLARRSKRTCERFRASRDEGCLVGQGERHIVGVELEAEPIARLAKLQRGRAEGAAEEGRRERLRRDELLDLLLLFRHG